jgi:uncharacterized protein (DUF2267 family)
MNKDQIVSAVRESARMDTRKRAEKAVRATLRVAEEGSGCTEQEARQHARAVTAALREAVGAEYLHLLDQLPEDYSDLMHTENVQH